MKIAIIGGGPAGLYAAILLKKQRPHLKLLGVGLSCVSPVTRAAFLSQNFLSVVRVLASGIS